MILSTIMKEPLVAFATSFALVILFFLKKFWAIYISQNLQDNFLRNFQDRSIFENAGVDFTSGLSFVSFHFVKICLSKLFLIEVSLCFTICKMQGFEARPDSYKKPLFPVLSEYLCHEYYNPGFFRYELPDFTFNISRWPTLCFETSFVQIFILSSDKISAGNFWKLFNFFFVLSGKKRTS